MTYTFPLLLAVAMTMTFFGKAIIGIVMGVTVIASLFTSWRGLTKDRIFASIRAPETIAILVMFGIWIISALQGIKPDKALSEVFEYIGIIAGGYLIFNAVQKNDFDFKKLFQYCVIGATACAVWLLSTPLVGDFAVEWGSSYGSVLTFFIPMAFYLTREKPIWWIAVLVLIMAIFASGGRTAWVALASLIIMMPWVMPIDGIKKRFFNFIVLGVVFAGGAMAGLQSYKSNVGEDVYQNRLETMMGSDRPASGRLTVWDNTIDLIIERPLLGYGIKAAQYLDISMGYDMTVVHVHNVVLEMMLETGILGFLAFSMVILIFVFNFLRTYWRSNNNQLKQISMVIFLSCIAYGVCSMALTSIFHAWWFLYLVVLVILLKVAELRLAPQAL